MRFLYDHLNAEGSITKVEAFGPQQLTTNLGAYLIWSVVMVRDLFETDDDSDKVECHLLERHFLNS